MQERMEAELGREEHWDGMKAMAGKCCGYCLILLQSTQCPQDRQETGLAPQHPLMLAVVKHGQA
jgi:hypothetical protein